VSLGPPLSVVIVSYNQGRLLARCLQSCTDVGEVVVVDNASTDPEIEHTRRRFDGAVKWISLPQNRGFSCGVNVGAAATQGEYLLILNPDTELLGVTATTLMHALRKRPGAGAVGFRQVDSRGNWQLSLGPRPGVGSEFVRSLLQRCLDRGGVSGFAIGRCLDVAARHFGGTSPVGWVAGSALLIRRRDFERVGGFDENYFLYFEDLDFCLRLADTVGPVYYDADLTMLHHRGASASECRVAVAAAYRRSQRRFWRTHGSIGQSAFWTAYTHGVARLRR